MKILVDFDIIKRDEKAKWKNDIFWDHITLFHLIQFYIPPSKESYFDFSDSSQASSLENLEVKSFTPKVGKLQTRVYKGV
jgi:hypothetical protein